MHAGFVQDLGAVDVPHAGEHVLVHQRQTHGFARLGKLSPQRVRARVLAQRVLPESFLLREVHGFVHQVDRHRGEQRDHPVAFQSQPSVRGGLGRGIRCEHAEPAAHPEVHVHDFARLRAVRRGRVSVEVKEVLADRLDLT
jgi:hypothetical protein